MRRGGGDFFILFIFSVFLFSKSPKSASFSHNFSHLAWTARESTGTTCPATCHHHITCELWLNPGKKIRGGQNGKKNNPRGDVTLNQHIFLGGLIHVSCSTITIKQCRHGMDLFKCVCSIYLIQSKDFYLVFALI